MSKWYRPSERMPERMQSVVVWKNGDWGHGWFDGVWEYGCEGFSGEPPEYWMVPESPESEE